MPGYYRARHRRAGLHPEEDGPGVSSAPDWPGKKAETVSPYIIRRKAAGSPLGSNRRERILRFLPDSAV